MNFTLKGLLYLVMLSLFVAVGAKAYPVMASTTVLQNQMARISNAIWPDTKIVQGSDTQAGDLFGLAVAVSGDTALVGAGYEDGGDGDPAAQSGAAYIFERNQGGTDNWGQTARLSLPDPKTQDYFGYALDLFEDTAVVGAYFRGGDVAGSGVVYVFERNQGGADNWGQTAMLQASDAKIGDFFGRSVAIWDDTIVVSAWAEDGGDGDPADRSGAAYIFERNQGGADNWGQVAILRANDFAEDDVFGWSVDLWQDTVVIGAKDKNLEPTGPNPPDQTGAAYIFERNQGGANNWGQVIKLQASDAQPGDNFGVATTVFSNTVAIGAYFEKGGDGDPKNISGAVYLYERNEGGADNWGQTAILRSSDIQGGDLFGSAVKMTEDRLLIGAYGKDTPDNSGLLAQGAAYLFLGNANGGTPWTEIAAMRAPDGQAQDYFGRGVGISGNTLIVGADQTGNLGNENPGLGKVYITDLIIHKLYLPVVIR